MLNIIYSRPEVCFYFTFMDVLNFFLLSGIQRSWHRSWPHFTWTNLSIFPSWKEKSQNPTWVCSATSSPPETINQNASRISATGRVLPNENVRRKLPSHFSCAPGRDSPCVSLLSPALWGSPSKGVGGQKSSQPSVITKVWQPLDDWLRTRMADSISFPSYSI